MKHDGGYAVKCEQWSGFELVKQNWFAITFECNEEKFPMQVKKFLDLQIIL